MVLLQRTKEGLFIKNRLVNSFLVALLAVLVNGTLHADDAIGGRCTEYFEPRIKFLLGCCGDLGADYTGPPFPDSMSEFERASRALNEVEAASKMKCLDGNSRGAMALKLDRIGAHIMRAQARLRPSSGVARSAALTDVKASSDGLRSFVSSHRDVSFRIWWWIATAFRLSGQLWDGLTFLDQLPDECCAGEAHAAKGDLLFELGGYQAAADEYSRWLLARDRRSLCGHATSLSHVAELRKRGFKMPTIPDENGRLCASGNDWLPYVVLPEDPASPKHHAPAW